MIGIKRLVWDEWNIAHIAGHSVTSEEVEEVCKGNFINRDGKKGRLLIIGLTRVGRMISIVLDLEPQEGWYYPVTARPSSTKERRQYQEERGNEKK